MRIGLFFLFGFCCVYAFTPAKGDILTPRFDGQLSFNFDGKSYQITDLPKFEDYPAEKSGSTPYANDINWTSHKKAWTFRTRLRNGLKKGPNFNGHYAVISHGCGSSCQSHWIVDVHNGKVIDTLSTTLGIQYDINSSLIICNLLGRKDMQEHIDARSVFAEEIVFYTLEKSKLSKIKVLDVYAALDEAARE